MTENSRNDLNIDQLKPILRIIKDNPNLIDSNSIKCIIFGYDLTKNNGVFEAKIYRKKIPLGYDVRQSIMDEIIKKLDYLTQEEKEFINWASSTNQNNFIVEVANIDYIDYDLRKIILNTDVNELLSDIKEIDGWKHKGLLTIIDINEYGKLIGISSIREKKVAHKKKNLISLENIGHGQVSLKFVSDIKLFSITDLFDAIYFMNKIIFINEEEVNKIFVLNKYFSDIYQKNIDLISKYINNPDELYRKILGNFRMQKKMITIIDYVLKKEVDPLMFKTKAQDFVDIFDEKIQFDENSKIDISNSDLQRTLELLSQSFDFAPITGEKRKVSPYYK